MFYVVGKTVKEDGTVLVEVPFATVFESKADAENFIQRVVPAVLPFLPKKIFEHARLVFDVREQLPEPASEGPQ